LPSTSTRFGPFSVALISTCVTLHSKLAEGVQVINLR
jgi:hypothetical protein